MNMRDMSNNVRAEVKRLVGTVRPTHEAEVKSKFTAAEAAARARGAGREFLDQIRLLWEMLIDSRYVVSWETKVWVIVALTYFINPVDLVPDVIPGVGYLDDALVVGYVLHMIAGEIAKYRTWRGGRIAVAESS